MVCLGYFDGVHAGHRRIIKEGKRSALRLGVRLCVHTYDIPPVRLIKPDLRLLELTPLEEKCRLLIGAGADLIAVSHFDDAMMHLSGQEFFDRVLLQKLHARHLVAGDDHHFGYRGETDGKALTLMCREAGIGVSILPAVRVREDITVSSTAVRDALLRGDFSLAEELLGRKPDAGMLSATERYKQAKQSS